MTKKLTPTPRIQAAILKSVGVETFDFSKVSIFATRSLNTLPIKKRGLFDGATATESLLVEMAAFVNNGGFVPMHTLHEQGYELPVGRVFAAEIVRSEQDLPELESYFFLDNEHEKLVSGVDTGSIEEVSVGVQSLHLNCSACGFDYLGAESGPDNIYGQVCANGHEIGVDGTHLILNGLSAWLEQSLVSLGAARGAKILSRTKSLLGNESYEKLAASGVSPEATVLFATTTLSPKPESKNMDMKELIEKNGTLNASLGVANHKVTEAEKTLALLAADKERLETELAAAKAAVPADATQAAAELKLAQDSAAASVAYLRKEADRLCVAAGVDKLAAEATFDQLTASIDLNRTKLEGVFHLTGINKVEDKSAEYPAASSFKTVR